MVQLYGIFIKVNQRETRGPNLSNVVGESFAGLPASKIFPKRLQPIQFSGTSKLAPFQSRDFFTKL